MVTNPKNETKKQQKSNRKVIDTLDWGGGGDNIGSLVAVGMLGTRHESGTSMSVVVLLDGEMCGHVV